MNETHLKVLAEEITRGLKGSLCSLIEQYRAKALLSEIRPQPSGMDRPVTLRQFQAWMRRGFTLPNGESHEPQIL